MDASLDEQRTLLELQAHDSAVDRLSHRRESLPEHARLAELGTSLAAIDQLTAERRGELATVSREQARLEDEVEMVRRKAQAEEARAISGRVTSPKELTAIQEEVAALHRRQSVLEDDLLERMERRETLEAELAELATRRDGVSGEQAEVTKARDGALAEIDREMEVERAARAGLEPKISAPLLTLYEQLRVRQKGIGAAALLGNTCQGCRVSLSPVELNALRALPAGRVKRCENCRRILVIA
ncbi:MAG TPA: C4-type zinc ribbon domain-containing protein [Actinomycetes bacterium]|nr:C4-type zinc ribbon domain-containing protein [Actinomycetes bacterium]